MIYFLSHLFFVLLLNFYYLPFLFSIKFCECKFVLFIVNFHSLVNHHSLRLFFLEMTENSNKLAIRATKWLFRPPNGCSGHKMAVIVTKWLFRPQNCRLAKKWLFRPQNGCYGDKMA